MTKHCFEILLDSEFSVTTYKKDLHFPAIEIFTIEVQNEDKLMGTSYVRDLGTILVLHSPPTYSKFTLFTVNTLVMGISF